MPIDEEEFAKLTKLCRIECSSKEKATLFQNISKTLSHITQLNEVGTQDIAPSSQVIETITNIMREDEEGPLLSREDLLANAPAHIGGMIKVPTILSTST